MRGTLVKMWVQIPHRAHTHETPLSIERRFMSLRWSLASQQIEAVVGSTALHRLSQLVCRFFGGCSC